MVTVTEPQKMCFKLKACRKHVSLPIKSPSWALRGFPRCLQGKWWDSSLKYVTTTSFPDPYPTCLHRKTTDIIQPRGDFN
jgi:hypothetical protein